MCERARRRTTADDGERRRTTAGGMQARKQKPHSDVGNKKTTLTPCFTKKKKTAKKWTQLKKNERNSLLNQLQLVTIALTITVDAVQEQLTSAQSLNGLREPQLEMCVFKKGIPVIVFGRVSGAPCRLIYVLFFYIYRKPANSRRKAH